MTNTTVSITGHTRGLGQILKQDFENNKWKVCGFSKTTGVDILDDRSRKNMIEQSMAADTFINSAHSGFGQVYVLNELFDAWRGIEGKTIVNISTDCFEEKDWELVPRSYLAEAAALNSTVARLQMLDRKCRILNIRLGYLDLAGNSNYPGPKLSCHDVFKFIWFALSQPQLEIKNTVLAAY